MEDDETVDETSRRQGFYRARAVVRVGRVASYLSKVTRPAPAPWASYGLRRDAEPRGPGHSIFFKIHSLIFV